MKTWKTLFCERENYRVEFRECGFSYENITFILDVVREKNPRTALLLIALKDKVTSEELLQLKVGYPHMADKIVLPLLIDGRAVVGAKQFILGFCYLLSCTSQSQTFES